MYIYYRTNVQSTTKKQTTTSTKLKAEPK